MSIESPSGWVLTVLGWSAPARGFDADAARRSSGLDYLDDFDAAGAGRFVGPALVGGACWLLAVIAGQLV